MGMILIHAGMPKVASSSIQTWLKKNRVNLKNEHGICVLRAEATEHETPQVKVTDATTGGILSESGAKAMVYLRPEHNETAQTFIDAMDKHANQYRTVVLTSETFAHALIRKVKPFLTALQRLAGRHRVIIACYIRPQHEVLEAAWRQWGYRTGEKPSDYIRDRMKTLDYLDTWLGVTQCAPAVYFRMRPISSAILLNGGVISDFVHGCLGLKSDAERDREFRSNPGLPLELINELQGRGPNALWQNQHDNSLLMKIKPFISSIDGEIPDCIHKSRDILMAAAHTRFENGNIKLSRRLKWGLKHLIPTPKVNASEDLKELDTLWARRCSDTTRNVLIEALAKVAKNK